MDRIALARRPWNSSGCATPRGAVSEDVFMDLLTDIQGAAVDPNHSVGDLLRKCQILAFRLKHEPFKAWVGHELNGYPNDATLPQYRASMRGELKAHLSGPFGSSGQNVPVPISLFPTAVRDDMTRSDFYQGVGMLESLVAQAEQVGQTAMQTSFPVEIYARLEIWQGYQTMRMWLEVPINAVAGVLDQVRSRALEFVLEIEAENPAAGEPKRGDGNLAEPPVSLARADAIFYNVIFGGQVAIGPNASVEVDVVPGELDSLMRYLEQHGVEKSDRDELAEAIEADAAEDASTTGPGKRVAAWLGRSTLKVAASGGRVGEGTAAAVLAAAVARYLGLM